MPSAGELLDILDEFDGLVERLQTQLFECLNIIARALAL